MQILDRAQTAQVLPYSRLVPAVAIAAQELAAGTIIASERQVVTIDPASVLLSMPAIGVDINVTKPGKGTRSSNVPVFKTVGQAAWDLAAARVAIESLQ
jgi:hypothetical protein